MAVESMVDHSPRAPAAVPPLRHASNLVLIDNYDSFTWNVFQYLNLEGATVSVYRNDEISLEQLIAKNPSQLVLSPGPGHPDTDTGITCSAIRHFSGKIPILGVCMGEQCIFSVFGGQVDMTGEILHGKTSPLRHDQKGVYAGLPQDLPVTRYHSLAGTHATLPECLEVSSWTSRSHDGGKGVIMGVRHKSLLVEGIQFHPESILTAEGRIMFRNFLQMRGGTWAEDERLRGSSKTSQTDMSPSSLGPTSDGIMEEESILDKIHRKRKMAVNLQKQMPSQRLSDLQQCYDMDLSPPSISFPNRLRSAHGLALMAEIKRASPSKGAIGMHISAPAQARKYAMAGASVISVLTEPDWFKGSIEDLRSVRQSLAGMPERPAVLRKEFIFDEYQILEARLAGADTVLLIVKMLDGQTLERLYRYCQSLGMEPLVEVNTAEEMTTAVRLGAQVIGINNRNLSTFEVDLGTTSRLMDGVPESTIICALSGISGPDDVNFYKQHGVGAVLVGEALMRAPDVGEFVSNLLSERLPTASTIIHQDLLVKICGTRTPEAAKAAIDAGADLIGIIMVPGRTRCVSNDMAKSISRVVHTLPKGSGKPFITTPLSYFAHTSGFFSRPDRALLVGVFQDQPLSYILSQQQLLNLDVVQLHGSEPIEWSSLIPVPVIRRFGPLDPGLASQGYHALPLLDSAVGGTGSKGDVTAIRKSLRAHKSLRVMLAGGLNADNVGEVLTELADECEAVIGVDVSSGVEINRVQDLDSIRRFIHAAKNFSRAR